MRLHSERKVSDPSQSSKLHLLPQSLLEEIFNKLENGKSIATARCVCKCFKEASSRIRSVRLVCLLKYHDIARAGIIVKPNSGKPKQSTPKHSTAVAASSTSHFENGESGTYIAQATQGHQFVTQSNVDEERVSQSDGSRESTSASTTPAIPGPQLVRHSNGNFEGGSQSDGKGESSTSITQASRTQHRENVSCLEGSSQSVTIGESSTSVAEGSEDDSGDESYLLIFRDVVVEFLKNKPFLIQLRIEIEERLQSKTVPEVERRRTDFWLSDPFHLRIWVPYVQATLQHLCIVDYGQQAIMRRTSILKILSQNCKKLKTLDLRNMFIDSNELEDMPMMLSFTLRCVKVTGEMLQHINDRMRNLTTLALLGVFGVTRGNLDFPSMKVLCLGLSTVAKDISMNLPSLVKLQLKMLCPEKLTVHAISLKFMAFNLEVRDTSKLELKNLRNLQEVLYGASSFDTLSSIVATNPSLNKLFLDIPCMALDEDGKWSGVLKDIPIILPSFNDLLQCEKLEVMNIGPGLWYSMEVNLEQLSTVENWPPFKTLILHMIPQNLDASLAVLRILLKPTLSSLQMYIHTNSPARYETVVSKVTEIVSHVGRDFAFKLQPWTKSLNFSCFGF